MPTPIEMMIDKVCNVNSDDFITLRCPKCKREKRALRDESDLPGTAIVEATCDTCESMGFDEVLYFDKNGNQLFD